MRRVRSKRKFIDSAPMETGSEARPEGRPLDAWAAVILVIVGLLPVLLPPHLSGLPAKALAFEAFGLAFLALALTRRSWETRVITGPTIALATLALVAIVGLPGAADFSTAAKAAAAPCAVLVLHLAAAEITRRPAGARLVLFALLAAAAAVATTGVLAAREFDTARAAGELSEADRSRLLSTPFFTHSYLAIQAVAPAVPIVIALMGRGMPLALRVTALLLGVPAALFAARVGSRGALLAIATAVVAIAFLDARPGHQFGHWARALRRPTRLLAALALLTAAFFATRTFAPELLERLASWLDPRRIGFNFGRLFIWEDSLQLAADAGPLGVGIGNFGVEFGRVHVHGPPLAHAHSQFVHWFTELGPVGLAAGIVAAFAPLARAWNVRKSEDAARARPFAVGLVVLLATFFFETPLAFPAGAAWFAILTGGIVGATATSPLAGGARVSRPTRLALLAVAAALAVTTLPLHARVAFARTKLHAAASAVSADDDAARVAAERAVAIAPWLPESWRMLAPLRLAAGDLDGALEAVHRHDRLAPGVPAMRRLGASLLGAAGAHADAAELLLATRPRLVKDDLIPTELELADRLAGAGRHEEARQLRLSLLARNVHALEPILLLRLAETLLALGRERTVAETLLREYLKRSEDDPAYARSLLDDVERFYAAPR